MNARHSLKEYIAALESAGLLKEHTLDEAALSRAVECLSYDTRKLAPNALFICKGANFKEEYLRAAFESGAMAYVAENAFAFDAPAILVSDVRHAIVVLGRLYYNNCMDELTTVAVTGTKGKSTTACYIRYILNDYMRAAGQKECAFLSSIDTYDGVVSEESHITTPDVLELYEHFDNAKKSGISHCVLETSSQALKYGRVRDLKLAVGAWLNIGLDHISPIEHSDFDDYFSSKLRIFDLCRIGCVNTDAEHGDEALAAAKASGCEVITYGSHESDTIYCEKIEKRKDGLYFTVRSPKYNGEFSITMPGIFNVSNALCAMAMAMALDIPEENVRAGLRVARAGGRMEVFQSRDGEVTVIVDYAHNKMSFEALYTSAQREYPGADIIGIFGAVGGKALQRRKDLGETASKYASYVFVAEDDPGEEPFESVATQIAANVTCPHEIEQDRGVCMRRAVLEHKGKRVILATGKGAETTMKRKGGYYDYPGDAAYARQFIAEYDALHN